MTLAGWQAELLTVFEDTAPIFPETAEVAFATNVGIIVIAAALMGFIATRSGQPTIIAYILTGVILGPVVLGIVEPGDLTETLAELGLAFLLFLLGIKMRLSDIQHILVPIVKISIPQMTLVAIVGLGTAVLLGFGFWESLIIGLAIMYSSTAVIIKMLTDKGTATSLHGKLDIGILLVQDIVVVILLAILAAGQPEGVVDIGTTLITVLVLVAIIGIVAIASSRYILPSVFRRIAGNTQVFFLISLSWLFLFVYVSESLNLSIEMGAFLAGIAIAQMPYSKELQARVSPLTDLFILVFFVSVSLELEAADLFEFWHEAAIAALILMPAKFIIFFYLLNWQGFDLGTTFLGSINMVQVSEFGLIVGAVAFAGGFIDEGILGFLTLVALLTMALSVYLINFNSLLFEHAKPHLERFSRGDSTASRDLGHTNHVVFVGFDEIARRAILELEDRYDTVVIIDRVMSEIEAIEEAGYSAVFGDAQYESIRKEAGLKDAEFVFSSTVQKTIGMKILQETKDSATVFLEAEHPEDAADLYDAGADYVVLTPNLSADQFQRYFDAYLTDRESFEDILQADLEIIQSGELFPRTRWSGSDD